MVSLPVSVRTIKGEVSVPEGGLMSVRSMSSLHRATERVKVDETSGGLKRFRCLLGLDLRTGLVDPHLGGQRRGLGPVSVEPVGLAA